MKAVILAAGLGTRLEPLTKDLPKCMVPVAGVPLVDRMIQRCAEAGIDELVVVTGHQTEKLQRHLAAADNDLARGARVVFNDRYSNWGNFYSLLVARDAIGNSDFIKFDADVLLDGSILPKLIAAPGPAVLVIDRAVALGQEEMKARVNQTGQVVELNKRMDPSSAIGESIGVERIDAIIAPQVFEALEAMIGAQQTDEYYELAYEHLMQRGVPFHYADISGALWCEVDDLQDLERAHNVIAEQETAARR